MVVYSWALPLLSILKLKISKSTKILQSCVVLKNLYGGATRTRKKFDDIFIRIDTILAVTDGHVAVAKTALAERRVGKNLAPGIPQESSFWRPSEVLTKPEVIARKRGLLNKNWLVIWQKCSAFYKSDAMYFTSWMLIMTTVCCVHCSASHTCANDSDFSRFFRPRLSSTSRTHLMLFSERPPIYVSYMTISGGSTEQHIITADFLPHHWLYEWFSRREQPNNTL